MKSQLLSCIMLLGIATFTACTQSQSKSVNKTDSLTQSAPSQILKPLTDIVALAKKQFEDSVPKLEDSDFVVGYTKVFTGDFTGDNQKDVAIYYFMRPRLGGNMMVGDALMIYEGSGDNVRFLMRYSPDYPFYCDTIKNGKIYLNKPEYKPDDAQCCPSINHSVELSYANNKISEKHIN